jgi:hypothetical protein
MCGRRCGAVSRVRRKATARVELVRAPRRIGLEVSLSRREERAVCQGKAAEDGRRICGRNCVSPYEPERGEETKEKTYNCLQFSPSLSQIRARTSRGSLSKLIASGEGEKDEFEGGRRDEENFARKG